MERAARLDRNMTEVAKRGNTVTDLGRFERFLASLHAVDEVLLIALEPEIDLLGSDLRFQDRFRLGLDLSE